MRRAIALVLSLTLSGCAAHRGPVAPGADRQHDWASVVAIPRGAPVRATVNYDIHGRLDDVTDSTLTIRVAPDSHRRTISRSLVVRVAVLTPKPKKARWGWLIESLAVTVGVVGGLVGAIVGAVMTDAKVAAISLGIFTASLIFGFNYVEYHWQDHEWRVVYVRP